MKAFQGADESTFETLRVGSAAPDFSLSDTDGKAWRLSDFRGEKWMVLIWVFADWCPVRHGEFHDLMASREAFEQSQVQVFTMACHHRYRSAIG
ncbi:MAG: peroxiredoxin family protein [Planctomycetota bacterium]